MPAGHLRTDLHQRAVAEQANNTIARLPDGGEHRFLQEHDVVSATAEIFWKALQALAKRVGLDFRHLAQIVVTTRHKR